ncbi:MAG TPA: flagellin [Burkholderiales bacterium]|jgi:flagellin|nr:flagellin [Burkholderiales bacterium]
MAATINTNTASLIAQLNLSNSKTSLQTSVQRLSSGLRINTAADDAAGLAIATRMNSQIMGMGVAMRNANDGISLAQTADGALSSVNDALQRMRELAVQARNATNGSSDRNSLDQEFGQLADEVQRVLGGTTFNGQAILGAQAGTQDYQIGAGTTSNDLISVTTTDMTSSATITAVAGTDNAGTGRAVIDSTSTTSSLGSVIDNIDAAIDTISSERALYGATQNRFNNVVNNLQIASENQSTARGRIMDADYAQETANLSRSQILQQAGTAMLAQANQMPQSVLQLLK